MPQLNGASISGSFNVTSANPIDNRFVLSFTDMMRVLKPSGYTNDDFTSHGEPFIADPSKDYLTPSVISVATLDAFINNLYSGLAPVTANDTKGVYVLLDVPTSHTNYVEYTNGVRGTTGKYWKELNSSVVTPTTPGGILDTPRFLLPPSGIEIELPSAIISPTELSYLDGASSNIQAQINTINSEIVGINSEIADINSQLLGKEDVANKATDYSTINTVLYPSLSATEARYNKIILATSRTTDVVPKTVKAINFLSTHTPDIIPATSIGTLYGVSYTDTRWAIITLDLTLTYEGIGNGKNGGDTDKGARVTFNIYMQKNLLTPSLLGVCLYHKHLENTPDRISYRETFNRTFIELFSVTDTLRVFVGDTNAVAIDTDGVEYTGNDSIKNIGANIWRVDTNIIVL